MKKIIESSRDLNKKEIYLMTTSKKMKSFKSVDDNTLVNVEAYCIFEDTESKRKVTLLSILDTSGAVYCGQSETFKNDFKDIIDVFGVPVDIIICHGVTKEGKDFSYCVLAD